MQVRLKGLTQRQAAAKAGMSERTARSYLRAGKLPSQLKRPRTEASTRPNPFEQDWPWVVSELEHDPALQGTTLFARLGLRQQDSLSPDTGTYPKAPDRRLADPAWPRARGDL